MIQYFSILPVPVFLSVMGSQLYVLKTSLLDDACDPEDKICARPNINMGDFQYRKCQVYGILRRIEQTTLLHCVKECFVTSQCTGINFRQSWKTCDVTSNSSYIENFMKEDGCIFSDISTWPQSMAGSCSNHMCKAGQRCHYIDNSRVCKDEFCTNLPSIQNAIVSEQFGAYRNINAGIRYTCIDGHVMEGTPYAVCRGQTNWEIMFNCVPERCILKEYEYNRNQNFCLKIFKTDGITWTMAREECQKDEGDLISIIALEKWNFVLDYLRKEEINNVWIGMRNKTWVTGVQFSNVFDVQVQLNDFDSSFRQDDCSCVSIFPNLINPLQDESCNLRPKKHFLCEITSF